MSPRGFAPAKVNLYLHVGPLGPDGYHPLESWMAFADIGDTLRASPAGSDSFQVVGPFAAGIPDGDDNLVVRARNAMDGLGPLALTLDKQLPPASGLGGGSSDAAAMLRLAAQQTGQALDAGLYDLALRLGSDVPACLEARSVIARGRGELLSPAPDMPSIPAVLVNPGLAVSTAAVFAAFDAAPSTESMDADLPPAIESPAHLTDVLGKTRNDLQAPAVALAPEIGAVLRALQDAPQSLFARMSGSGASCFAICQDDIAAKALADDLARGHPSWWVRACHLA